ncbi:MAG TPA: molecular chaperone DnaJ [Acidimicrobiales bacterium]|nr:molecular chaperone DnaJ [Acidimicrobiales bacterium]
MPAQREWFETDYYKVLGVAADAGEKEITRAYRKLAKQYHPDANPGSEERFKEISAAYDVLGDADKRKEYDEVRRVGAAGNPFGNGNAGFNFKVEDLTDLFGGLFRPGNAGGMSRRRSGAGPQRGMDTEASLHLAFDEAVEGVVTTVNVATGATCATCAGSGSRPGSTPVVCPRCGGSGTLNDNQGLFSLSSPCPECRGRGTKIVDPCPTCMGTGMQRKERQVKVRIPPGVADGARIKVKGRGEPGRNGGPAGDLYVTVSVAEHRLFGRRGRDLTLNLPITFAEAALGAEVTVPTLDKPVTLKIPAGTKSGKTFRVRGRGLRAHGEQGDLLVTADITVPAELSEEERQALKSYAEATNESPRKHLET